MPAQTESLEQWRAAGEYFTFDSHRIFFRQSATASRRPLLLIHGYPTASWDWARIWDCLAADFRLIAPDMLGFGFSAKPRGHRYSIREQCDLLVALCRHLQLTQVELLAHDYGVTVAQELLARHDEGGPLRLRSVTLLNGGLFPETHHARLVQKLLAGPVGPLIARAMGRRQFGRSFAAVFGPDTQPSAAELDAFWQLVEEQNGRMALPRLQRYIAERRANRSRWVGALQNTAVPLQLINGNADPVSGAHMVQRYRELVPSPNVTDLPGIGHYPQFEAPEAVLVAFQAFQSGLVADAA
jgi:pimeloyl-ACP methyl ester carboxylesterase